MHHGGDGFLGKRLAIRAQAGDKNIDRDQDALAAALRGTLVKARWKRAQCRPLLP